jgi:hypothetical protein
MARGRRLRKSTSGELEMNKENGTASDDANLLPNVVVSNEAILLPNVAMSNEAILLPNVNVSNEANVEQHVAATAEQIMATTDETIGDQSNVALDQPIGEQNGALSWLGGKKSQTWEAFNYCKRSSTSKPCQDECLHLGKRDGCAKAERSKGG